MFEGDETGENIWWNAERVDPDLDSDPENPEVFVMYDENGEAEEGQQEKQEYYLEPLLGDYLDHYVQIFSLHLDFETGEWICYKARNWDSLGIFGSFVIIWSILDFRFHLSKYKFLTFLFHIS